MNSSNGCLSFDKEKPQHYCSWYEKTLKDTYDLKYVAYLLWFCENGLN